jgi:hypothetical protein
MNQLDKRIFDLMDMLMSYGEIRFKVDFCRSVGMYPQVLNQIASGRNHFTLEQVNSICKVYNVNANWILGTEDNVFTKDSSVQIVYKDGEKSVLRRLQAPVLAVK